MHGPDTADTADGRYQAVLARAAAFMANDDQPDQDDRGQVDRRGVLL